MLWCEWNEDRTKQYKTVQNSTKTDHQTIPDRTLAMCVWINCSKL
jgi:hypothetical protein